MEKFVIFEWCSNCDFENEFVGYDDKLVQQKCKECGDFLLPCSDCSFIDDCTKCPFIAHINNKVLENNTKVVIKNINSGCDGWEDVNTLINRTGHIVSNYITMSRIQMYVVEVVNDKDETFVLDFSEKEIQPLEIKLKQQ